MSRKPKAETILENIDKAIIAIQKINAKGFGWDIESTIADAMDSLIQAKGLIKRI